MCNSDKQAIRSLPVLQSLCALFRLPLCDLREKTRSLMDICAESDSAHTDFTQASNKVLWANNLWLTVVFFKYFDYIQVDVWRQTNKKIMPFLLNFKMFIANNIMHKNNDNQKGIVYTHLQSLPCLWAPLIPVAACWWPSLHSWTAVYWQYQSCHPL